MSAGQVSSAVARRMPLGGVVRSTTSRPTGTMKAPPTPCSARAAMKNHAAVENPQSAELSVNSAIAAVSTARAPKRSTAQALGRMKIATVSA